MQKRSFVMVPCYWSRSNKPKAKPRKCDTHGPRPLLEWLEDRLLPSATLVVVANSYPTDAFHFHTLQDALVAAAGSPDIIQVEPGADPGIFNSTTLAAA